MYGRTHHHHWGVDTWSRSTRDWGDKCRVPGYTHRRKPTGEWFRRKPLVPKEILCSLFLGCEGEKRGGTLWDFSEEVLGVMVRDTMSYNKTLTTKQGETKWGGIYGWGRLQYFPVSNSRSKGFSSKVLTLIKGCKFLFSYNVFWV